MKKKQQRRFLTVVLSAALALAQVPFGALADRPVSGADSILRTATASDAVYVPSNSDYTGTLPEDTGTVSLRDNTIVHYTLLENSEVRIDRLELPKYERTTGLTIPDHLTVIDSRNVIQSYTVTEIGPSVLAGPYAEADSSPEDSSWNMVDEIILPTSIKKIGGGNFSRIPLVQEIRLSNSITELEGGCFQDMEGLQTVKLPSRINTIKSDSFWNLPNLETLILPSSLQTIEGESFMKLPMLTSLEFPITTSIIQFSFRETGLREVTIPIRVRFIAAGSFSDCPDLEKAYLYCKNAEFASVEGTPKIFEGAAENFTIYGIKASSAERFARACKYPFLDIDNPEPPESWQYFSFANSASDFFRSGEEQNYTIKTNFWSMIRTNLQILEPDTYLSTTAFLRDMSKQSWGGSCYGIAVTEGLYNNQLLNLNPDGQMTPPDAPAPSRNLNIRSLLNGYFLMQFTGYFDQELHWGCVYEDNKLYYKNRTDWTDNLLELIAAIEQEPVLFGYQMIINNSLAGHAIILESAEDQGNGIYKILARDNRFPGERGTGETWIAVDLNAHGGKGSLVLTQPAPYSQTEEAIGFMFTSDFQQFSDLMPLDITMRTTPKQSEIVSGNKLLVEASGQWQLSVGEETLEAQSGVLPSSDAVQLRGAVMGAALGNSGGTAPLQYVVTGDSEITFTPETSNDSFGIAYHTDSGYGSVFADGGAQVLVSSDGAAYGEDLSGTFTISTAAGDGALIQLKGTAGGTESDDFILVPTDGGANVTVPAGQYQVKITNEAGQEASQTIRSREDGTTVTVTVPDFNSSDDSDDDSDDGSYSRSNRNSGTTQAHYPVLTGTIPSSEGFGIWEALPDNSWKFLKDSGTYGRSEWLSINGSWYLFDENAVMITGWASVNGTWYYLNTSGAMVTGWQLADGKWYYLKPDGSCLMDGVTPDGFQVDASGAWIQ